VERLDPDVPLFVIHTDLADAPAGSYACPSSLWMASIARKRN
jgi:hypothetical protein